MANIAALDKVLREQFTSCNDYNRLSLKWFNEYMYMCIDNDADQYKEIMSCKKSSIPGRVWYAVLEHVNYLFEYYEIATSPATSEQLKKALERNFGIDYKSCVAPVVDRFVNDRKENERC